jgi:hypothetical protein
MKTFGAITIVLFLLLMLSGCSSEPPADKQTRLLNTLQSMELAIEEKRLDDFMDQVSDDFVSSGRGWGKKDAERLLRLRLMRNKHVHVHQAVKDISWHEGGDQQATVEVVVAAAGTEFSLTDLPRLRGDLVRFVVTFVKDDDEYLVSQTEWQRASPGDFL